MFQKKAIGSDVRVHSLESRHFAVEIKEKDAVDYRYSSRSSFTEIAISKNIAQFSSALNFVEQNPLIGVDFIKNKGIYYCLESNPSPGWSWYYNSGSLMCQTLLENLQNEN